MPKRQNSKHSGVQESHKDHQDDKITVQVFIQEIGKADHLMQGERASAFLSKETSTEPAMASLHV